MRLIVTCGCGDTDKFAVDAFKILLPTQEVPAIVSLTEDNRPAIACLFELINSALEYEHSDMLLSVDGKFAVYIETNRVMSNDIEGVDKWGYRTDLIVADLIKGVFL